MNSHFQSSAGIDQVTNSIRPSYASSRLRRARGLDARYHQAKPSVARTTGTTTTNMIAVELTSNSRSAAAIGPCGSNTPALLHDASGNTAARAAARNMAVHPSGDGIDREPVVMRPRPGGALGKPT